jgi:hypothetical protein
VSLCEGSSSLASSTWGHNMLESSETYPRRSGMRPSEVRATCGRLAALLRRIYPANTTQNVEADTGIPAKTVEGWLGEKSKPGYEHFGRLLAAYGPPVLEAAWNINDEWIDEAARAHRIRQTKQKIRALEAALAREVA